MMPLYRDTASNVVDMHAAAAVLQIHITGKGGNIEIALSPGRLHARRSRNFDFKICPYGRMRLKALLIATNDNRIPIKRQRNRRSRIRRIRLMSIERTDGLMTRNRDRVAVDASHFGAPVKTLENDAWRRAYSLLQGSDHIIVLLTKNLHAFHPASVMPPEIMTMSEMSQGTRDADHNNSEPAACRDGFQRQRRAAQRTDSNLEEQNASPGDQYVRPVIGNSAFQIESG